MPVSILRAVIMQTRWGMKGVAQRASIGVKKREKEKKISGYIRVNKKPPMANFSSLFFPFTLPFVT